MLSELELDLRHSALYENMAHYDQKLHLYGMFTYFRTILLDSKVVTYETYIQSIAKDVYMLYFTKSPLSKST